MDAVTGAPRAAKVQAYEPALAYIAVASAALKSTRWRRRWWGRSRSRSRLQGAARRAEARHRGALRRGGAPLRRDDAGALEWKERITPIVAQQLEAARVRAIELSKEAVKLHEAQLKLVAESKKLGAQIEPHLTAAGEGRAALAPALKSVSRRSRPSRLAEETQKKVAPVLVLVGAALQEWGILKPSGPSASSLRSRSPPSRRGWFRARVPLLPLLKPITYDGGAGGYPPPTLAVEPANRRRRRPCRRRCCPTAPCRSGGVPSSSGRRALAPARPQRARRRGGVVCGRVLLVRRRSRPPRVVRAVRARRSEASGMRGDAVRGRGG